ncbi:MAG: hypothetical protein JRJ00_00425 [Deltaproteobacteria bacterium]|nr:hypothetical protein [Deltaproteobacteria bacterium]
MTCFYKKNKFSDLDKVTSIGSCPDVLTTPKFYNQAYIEKKKGEVITHDNVIKVALDAINLSLDEYPCGDLPKYDVYNMSAVQVIKLGLLEGIKNGNFYELYLDETGTPFIISTGKKGLNVVSYYSVIHSAEKVEYCVIVKGFDPMPERIVKDTIPLVVNGEGDGVEIIGLGNFMYDTCGNRVYDYNGCISYGDPHLEDTTKDEMDSAFELEPFESLIGYAFTCQKPEDVDVTFSDTTQIVIPMLSVERELTGRETRIEDITVDITDRKNEIKGETAPERICNPCIRIEPDEMSVIYESDVAILSVDQVIVRMDRITNYKSSSKENYSDVCYTGGEEGGNTSGSTSDLCDYFDIDSGVRQLTIGQDFYYKIEDTSSDEKVSNILKAAIPVQRIPLPSFHIWWDAMTRGQGFSVTYKDVIKFAGSASHVFFPFDVFLLLSIDKPSIFINKKTDKAIGRINDSGAIYSEGHTKEIEEIAKEITLCATPIVTLDKPSNTAYYADGVVTFIAMEDCIQDSDPTTEEDLNDTPCEQMAQATSGKVTVDITLPFLDDEGIQAAASLLGGTFSAEYTQGSSVVPGNAISASDLGKKFKGGIVNKIVWSYQDKSFYKATVSIGPFLTGADSFNTSLWIRRTDQSLSREGVVTGDYGNGLEFKVYVRNIGTYTALNMTMNTIEIGDVVNVTIYNNPAESYFE